MRADRLLSLLMLLQARGQMSAQELADELEVSERTIYRDITALSSSGVPVYASRGPGGGVRLIEEYRTTLTAHLSEETRALFMMSIPAPLTQLGMGEKFKGALLKLSASLPDVRRAEETNTASAYPFGFILVVSIRAECPVFANDSTSVVSRSLFAYQSPLGIFQYRIRTGCRTLRIGCKGKYLVSCLRTAGKPACDTRFTNRRGGAHA